MLLNKWNTRTRYGVRTWNDLLGNIAKKKHLLLCFWNLAYNAQKTETSPARRGIKHLEVPKYSRFLWSVSAWLILSGWVIMALMADVRFRRLGQTVMVRHLRQFFLSSGDVFQKVIHVLWWQTCHSYLLHPWMQHSFLSWKQEQDVSADKF